jgi:hypothetical protein
MEWQWVMSYCGPADLDGQPPAVPVALEDRVKDRQGNGGLREAEAQGDLATEGQRQSGDRVRVRELSH